MGDERGSGEFLMVTSGEQEHHLARAHVVDIVFLAQEATSSGRQGGTWQSDDAGAGIQAARFVARIVTLAPGRDGPYTVEVYDDEARRLRDALGMGEAGWGGRWGDEGQGVKHG
jgi:hypothetical protein